MSRLDVSSGVLSNKADPSRDLSRSITKKPPGKKSIDRVLSVPRTNKKFVLDQEKVQSVPKLSIQHQMVP